MPDIAIEVRGLRKRFGKVEVLKGVDLAVQSGTIFALLGANGAGKTTTINVLATLTDADAGEAFVDGISPMKHPTGVRKVISLTGQFVAVDDVLTGRENVELIANLHHESGSKELARKLLRQFALDDAADRRVGTYSGGMRRRLDIAMSLIGNPKVIFLDEPTTGLDPQSRNMMWSQIRDLKQSGTTVFLTTQYLDEADELADEIAILRDGRIVAHGTPHELKQLVPRGTLKLEFPDEESLKKASRILVEFKPYIDTESMLITIAMTGEVRQVAKIFSSLKDVDVSHFSQDEPTLDDVFLEIVNNKEKK